MRHSFTAKRCWMFHCLLGGYFPHFFSPYSVSVRKRGRDFRKRAVFGRPLRDNPVLSGKDSVQGRARLPPPLDRCLGWREAGKRGVFPPEGLRRSLRPQSWGNSRTREYNSPRQPPSHATLLMYNMPLFAAQKNSQSTVSMEVS